jgi:ribosomal protein L11 methyltransferase
MAVFRALDVDWPTTPADELVERLLAEIDDCRPTALEPRERGVRLFFTNDETRERAAELAHAFAPTTIVESVDVPDEAWAERSQAKLEPIRAGRFVVTPPWHVEVARAMAANDARANPIVLVIQPSMGFGTGHHASTRLCLRLLQDMDLVASSVLDVGTGSGVLAIAAVALGASHVTAIDVDIDALTAARENVGRNDAGRAVTLRTFELGRDDPHDIGTFDVLTANLTGGILERHAPVLASWTRGGGTLIASGYQTDEAEFVTAALRNAGFTPIEQLAEDEWMGGTFEKR